VRRLMTNQALRNWEPFVVERVEGKTLGIIGFGSIGHAIAKRAEPFGMKVITARRTGGTPIDELIAASDYLVLSTPLTSATQGLLDAGRIALMRPDAVLINISRGAVVDENALVEALRTKRIRGAALDVFSVEPLPADHPLWSLENVLICPHSADRAADSHTRSMTFFLANLDRFERGEPLQNVVDLTAGY
jgi:phosphoglycerate dehydrogenase-like enzyme